MATIDPRIEQSLRQSGQIGISAINRSLYGLDSLSATISQASQTNTTDVAPITFQTFTDLTGNQKTYFDASSRIIADNTNNAINSLENNLKGKILPQIQSNAQDQAIMSGQISGDLNLTPLDSSRNLSFVSNAQAVGQQQILASINEFSQNITNAVTAGQSNQVQLLGQANQSEMANKQFQFSKDQFLTQVKGTLFDNGKDTGQQTLSLRSQIFNEDRALGAESGYIFKDGQATGAESLNLKNTLFQQDRALGQERGTVFNRGVTNGVDTFAKDQFDFQSDISTKQLSLNRDQFDLSKDEFITRSTGDLTLNGQKDGRVTLAKLDTISSIAAREQNTELVKQQVEDYKINILKTQAMIAEFQPKSSDQRQALRDKFGDGVELYWTGSVTTDAKGNAKTDVIYADDALATKGLFLNVNFENQNYKNAVTNAGIKPDDTPEFKLSRDVMNAIQNGKSTEMLNKIGIQSDNGEQVLLALKTNDKGDIGYTFKDIDLSKLSKDKRGELNQALANIDLKSPNLLQESNDVIQKYTNYRDISPIGYMQRLQGANFANNGQKSMTNTLPNNVQLMAGIIGSGKGNSINNLADKKVVNVYQNGFNFEPLQNLYTISGKIKMNDYAENDFSNFSGKSNSESLRNTFIEHYNNTDSNKKGAAYLPQDTYNMLTSLKETNQIISSQYNDKNSIYAGDLMKSFMMGSLKLSEAQANGMYQVINRLK